MQGYGFRSLEDLFEEAYSGKLAKRGRQQVDADDRYAMLREWQNDNKRAVPRESDKIVIYAEALEQITTKQNELREPYVWRAADHEMRRNLPGDPTA